MSIVRFLFLCFNQKCFFFEGNWKEEIWNSNGFGVENDSDFLWAKKNITNKGVVWVWNKTSTPFWAHCGPSTIAVARIFKTANYWIMKSTKSFISVCRTFRFPLPFAKKVAIMVTIWADQHASWSLKRRGSVFCGWFPHGTGRGSQSGCWPQVLSAQATLQQCWCLKNSRRPLVSLPWDFPFGCKLFSPKKRNWAFVGLFARFFWEMFFFFVCFSCCF